jgi:hypothetical protein
MIARLCLVIVASSLGSCMTDLACEVDEDCPNAQACVEHRCDPSTPAGEGDGNVDGDLGDTGLGAWCDACDGTWCASGGTFINDTCDGSDLSLPCVGTAAGMYCSTSCESDADCDNEHRAMSCLTECVDSPTAAGRCWTASSAAFMRERVCPL